MPASDPAQLPPGFAGAALDRASVLRTDGGWVAARWRDPESRAVGVADDAIVVVGDDPVAPARLDPRALAAHGTGESVLLGLEAGRALFGVDLRGVDPATLAGLGPGARLLGLRDAGALLSQADGGLVAYAAALLNWHRHSSHCSGCGTATRVEEAGHLRRCPHCGTTHHPRTDPVVIMLVTDGDRVLLGRQPVWPEGFYSALAGFVEPGESLEEAVAREVREESGIEVSGPRGELEDVRWFTAPRSPRRRPERARWTCRRRSPSRGG